MRLQQLEERSFVSFLVEALFASYAAFHPLSCIMLGFWSVLRGILIFDDDECNDCNLVVRSGVIRLFHSESHRRPRINVRAGSVRGSEVLISCNHCGRAGEIKRRLESVGAVIRWTVH